MPARTRAQTPPGGAAHLGEHIEVVRCDPTLRLPNDNYFDVLLFDRNTALIHDYGTGEVGRQTGGWVTHEPATIATLDTTIANLRRTAAPLRQYLAYDTHTIELGELRGALEHLTTSRDMHTFWRKARAARSAVTGGDEAEDFFTAEVDRAYAQAAPLPPQSLPTALGDVMSEWRKQRKTRHLR